MNRVTIVIVRGLIIAALLFAGSNAPAQTAPLVTAVCGTLPGSTTWSLGNSPYVVCAAGVIVPVGAILTIDPGATIQFTANALNKLTVNGTLVANGSITQKITLTGLDLSPGSWGGIYAVGTALNPAHVTLSYITLDYGGIGSSGGQVYADHTVLSITHSQIRNSASNGVYTTLNTPLDAHDVSFVDNALNAIQLNQPSTNLLMTGLTSSGIGTNGVRVAGSSVFHGQKRWGFTGIPYIVDGPVRTDLGDVLTIDPGNTLRFTPSGWLYVRGRLNALGTASKPILLTAHAQPPTPGSWVGLFIDGGVHQAVAQLDYVTIEFAGSGTGGANIHVANGRLIAAHSIIRNSAKDGIRFDSNYGGSILESQIVNNALYGLHNGTPGRAVLATNNWWGDASGPQSDVVACVSGSGAKVTAGVLFLPVLSGPNATLPFPLSSAPIVTLTPRRWFAPADNLSRIYFDISVRDGNGAPIPGRTVKLTSSLGVVTDGAITDPNGKALAFITSGSVGDAVVNASLNVIGCEGALSPETTVTFTAPVTATDLMPNAPASYFDGDIQISPMPVVSGVNTTITARLTNPLATPITVDVSFNFVEASIGLVFGPIKDIIGQVIPANSSVLLSAAILPVLSGHYCVEIVYSITAVGLNPVHEPQANSGRRQLNLNAQQGSMGQPSAKETLARADTSFKLVSKLPSGPTQVQKAIVGGWWGWASGAVSWATEALGLDPPRQDYNQITLPVRYAIPSVQPGANISVQRAAALNAVNTALTEVLAFGGAAATAMDRYGGASEANNLQWASEQANELLYYQEQFGTALLSYADLLDAFVLVLQTEGETQITVSVSDVTSYQQRLTTPGFSVQEIADAKLLGWTDAQIETQRLAILAANPIDVAGNLLEKYTNEASVSRALGNALLYPPVFNPSYSVSGSPGRFPTAAAGNSMAQVFNSIATLQLGNPLAQTALIDVKARRIDLPADWTVDVSPVQVSLLPGEQTTVTVTVMASSPVPQGSIPRVAVEGYAGSQLLGGVVIDTVVPYYKPFDGKLHVFLPLTRK